MKITHPETHGVLEVADEQYDAFAEDGWKRAPDDEPTDYEVREWHHLQPDYLDAANVSTVELRKRWHDEHDQTPAGAPAAPPSTINPPPQEDPPADESKSKSAKSRQTKE